MSELESLIEKLYKDQEVNREKIEACLRQRGWLLNQTFEWTPEKKEKLLCLNQKLIECWEKVDAEAKQKLKILNERIKQPDDVFISQAIHDLYDHSYLSFPDIMKINRFRVELSVVYQYFVEV